MPDFRLDDALIDALTAGSLDERSEAVLAEQVARLLPYHWALPNPVVAGLARLRKHWGGDAGMHDWLGRHPGYPRLVARLYELMGMLDWLSGQPAVVEALRDLRTRLGDPKELTGYLAPDTDTSTLASIGTTIESLLGEGRVDEAVEVGFATVTLLLQAAPGASEIDPSLGDLAGRVDLVRRRLLAAVDEYRDRQDRARAEPGDSRLRR